MDKSQTVILSIAGSDPSGGAGIQADLKTISSLGVYGCAAISALTVQNTKGVYRVEPVDPEMVRAQIDKVLEDMPVSHIKTGMIGSGAVAKAIGESLISFKGVLICDPVLKASSGHDLLPPAEIETLLHNLVSKSTALTPNLDELKTLTGLSSEGNNEICHAAESLLEKFPDLKVVIVKGGHWQRDQQKVTDLLLLRKDGEITVSHSTRPRIQTSNSHGTGCTYASALAAYHLKTNSWPKAFQLTGEYVSWLLAASSKLKTGHGNGPLQHHLYRNNDQPGSGSEITSLKS
jgi:hydroxymethylpyrimidine/phosphomethylpyrimidine kinase